MSKKSITCFIMIIAFCQLIFPDAYSESEKNMVDFSKDGITAPDITGGKWRIGERDDTEYCSFSFDDRIEAFEEIYGEWAVSGGAYEQNGLSPGAAARALLPDQFSDFTMEFDVTPLSDETKIMAFFGCTSLYHVCVAEITEGSSALVLGEDEIRFPNGHAEKGKNYHIKLICKENSVFLYQDSELLICRDNIAYPLGRIGIGCWNSKARFDNFSVISPDALGGGNKLIKESKDFAAAYFPIYSNDYLYAKIASDSLIDSDIGLFISDDKQENTYLFGIDPHSAFICYGKNKGKKIINKISYPAYAKKYYTLGIKKDRKETVFYIDSKEILRADINTDGISLFGVYSENTGLCCEVISSSDTIVSPSDGDEIVFSGNSFSDTPSSQRYIDLLGRLGIIGGYNDNTFRPNEYMLREEFAAIIYKMQNILPPAVNASLSDCDESKFLSYINAAVKGGYMTSDRSYFYPYEPVSPDDAAYALVKILSKGVLDNKKEAVKNADMFDLFDKTKITGNALTRNAAAQMIFNALNASSLMPSFSGGQVEYQRGGSLLSDVFSVTPIKTTILANKFINAYADRDIILSGNEIITTSGNMICGFDTNDLIGVNCECYVRKNRNDEDELLLAAPYKSSKTVIDQNCFISCSDSFIRYYEYDSSSKEKSISLSDSTVIVYNDQYYKKNADCEREVFDISNGRIVIVSNSNSGYADYCFIEENLIYCVDTVSYPNSLIYDKTGKDPLSCDPLKDKCIIIKDGKEIDITDIKEYDIISVRFPKRDNGYVKLYVSSVPSAEGIISRISSNGIIIGDNEYKVSPVLNEAFSAGDRVCVYFDIYSAVSYMKITDGYDYGYITKFTYDKEDSGEIYLNMFTFDNGKGIFTFAEKVTVKTPEISSKKYTKNSSGGSSFLSLGILIDDMLSSSRVYNEKGELTRTGCAVRYRANSNKEITEIDFPKDKTGLDMPYNEKAFSCFYDSARSGESVYYYSGLINSKYRITQNTKILSLGGTGDDTYLFSKISPSSLPWDKYYTAAVFDVNDEFEAKALIIKNTEHDYDSVPCIIGRITSILDENDESAIFISMMKNGEEISEKADNADLESDMAQGVWFKNPGVKIKDLSPGDIIIYTKNSNGYIDWFSVMFKNKEQDFYATSPRGWYWGTIPSTDMTLTYTEVTKKTGSIFVFNSNNYSRPITNAQNAKYYLFNRSRKTVEPVGFDNVKAGDKLVMIWKTARLDTVVIYR